MATPGGFAIPRGGGRGFGDGALNRDGGVVGLRRLDRLLAFDPAEGIVGCEAGCTIGKLIETFLPRGWFPLVTPGTKHVTVGGAIAADVHGKNHHREGSFTKAVIDFKLIRPSGEVLDVSRESNPDIFWATLGGMGSALGFYLRTMRAHPASAEVVERAARTLSRRPRALESLLWRRLGAEGWRGPGHAAAAGRWCAAHPAAKDALPHRAARPSKARKA